MEENETYSIDLVIEQINNRKDSLSNSGARPLVGDIIQKAKDIVGFITNNNSDNSGKKDLWVI